jgi:hypothetical protein
MTYISLINKILNEKKVGDTIVHMEYRSRYSQRPTPVVIGTVTRITKTQIVVDGIRFNKRDGREIGGDSIIMQKGGGINTTRLWTEEEGIARNTSVAECDKIQKLRSSIEDAVGRGRNSKEFTLAQLQQVTEILELETND